MTRLSTNKNIVVSGCSFTRWGGYNWPDALNKYNTSLYNVGHKGNCNENIIKKAINQVKSLSKISSDQPIVLIVQLTGLERFMLNGKISPTIRNIYEADNKFKFNWFGMKNKTTNNDFKDYVENVYTPELHLNNLFKEIILLDKTVEELKNVDYRIFCGWDIFCNEKK